MSRRCKKGQRARVIRGKNAGAIVLVLRPYFFPQKFDDTVWYNYRFPWAVTSLGRPLVFSLLDGKLAEPTQSGVVEDEDMQPLDDEDDGFPRTEDLRVPVTKSQQSEGMAQKDVLSALEASPPACHPAASQERLQVASTAGDRHG